MHPAKSVIAFTTLSGLGFGMMFWLGLGFGPSGSVAGPLACLAALALAGVGLLCSTLHLGNPQRFLKAFSQWRSSWLSREGVVSVILMALFFLYAVLWLLNGAPPRVLGVIAAILAISAVICTAMIYGQLKTVPRWSHPLTVPMFLGYAIAGGVIGASLARAAAGDPAPVGLGLALLAASALAYGYRRVVGAATLKAAGSSPESATGLGDFGRVRLLESPHSAPNYLMKEMVYRVGRNHADKIALISVLGGLFAPLFLFILFRDAANLGVTGAVQVAGLSLALLLHVIGTLASRWLFFAEAEHAVGLYYGKR